MRSFALLIFLFAEDRTTCCTVRGEENPSKPWRRRVIVQKTLCKINFELKFRKFELG